MTLPLQRASAVLCVVGLVSLSAPVAAEIERLAEADETFWSESLLPLPQEMTFHGEIAFAYDGIALTPASSRGATAQRLAQEFGEWAGEEPRYDNPAPTLRIALSLADESPVALPARMRAASLRDVQNREQAYVLDIDETGLVTIHALAEPGLFYGGMTLLQLLDAGRDEAGTVSLPLVTIRDWPSMEERGVWNHSAPEEWIPWMSSMKMNYSNMWTVTLERFVRGERNRATINAELMNRVAARGFRHIPQILHLNFLDRYGIFSAYPELAGFGPDALAGRYFAHKKGSMNRVPFAGHPLMVEILRDWMLDMAEQGSSEVVCWLTERPAEDGRVETREVGQFVLEGRAFVQAWEEAREQYPDLRIRLFLSTTETVRNYRVIHEAPPDVKIVRACAIPIERVTRLPRDIYANPVLDSYAAEGRWIGSYDVPLIANGKVETPEFKLPHRSPHRIRHFAQSLIDRKYRSASGMMAWSNHSREICSMNVSALAEWTWNPDGRDEIAFARAWARRNGLDPDAVAEWSGIMGPIEWDVYDSGFPEKYAWDEARAFIEAESWPYLGEGLFRYYTTLESFDEKSAAVRQAAVIAEQIDDASFLNETHIIETYIMMDQALYRIARGVAVGGLDDLEAQRQMREHLQELEEACAANAKAIEEWRNGYGEGEWHNRVHDAIASTKRVAEEVTDLVRHRYLYD